MNIELEFEHDAYFGVPDCVIAIDGHTVYSAPITDKVSVSTQIPDGVHELRITHLNKKKQHTRHGHDRHFVLKRLIMEGIDLDQFEHCRMTHQGRFYPQYHTDYIRDMTALGETLPEYIQPNHYFGHNGSWILTFETPVLPWIIRVQNPSGMHLEDTIFDSTQDTIQDIKQFFNLNT